MMVRVCRPQTVMDKHTSVLSSHLVGGTCGTVSGDSRETATRVGGTTLADCADGDFRQ